jgi:hypothetical protein
MMLRIYQPLLMCIALGGFATWKDGGLIAAGIALGSLAVIEAIGIMAKAIMVGHQDSAVAPSTASVPASRAVHSQSSAHRGSSDQ